jgi:hypothetical protein
MWAWIEAIGGLLLSGNEPAACMQRCEFLYWLTVVSLVVCNLLVLYRFEQLKHNLD